MQLQRLENGQQTMINMQKRQELSLVNLEHSMTNELQRIKIDMEKLDEKEQRLKIKTKS